MLRESEARHRALITATSYVTYVMSPDWAEMRHLDGRGFLADKDAPSGAWFDTYIAPEDQPRAQEAIADAIRRKGIFDLEHRVRRADGTFGWTHSRAVPLLDEAGRIREWFGAASDVTERARTEAVLRQGEERLRLALDAAEMGSFVWHAQEDRAEPDARTLALFGMSEPGEMTFRRVLDLTHPGDQEAHAAAVARALDPAGKGTLRSELRIALPDGTWRWLALAGQTYFDSECRAASMIGAARDITARKEAEAALRERDEHNAFLVRFSEGVRGLSDPWAVAETACRLAAEKLGTERAYWAEIDWESREYVIGAAFHLPGVPAIEGRFSLDDWEPFTSFQLAGRPVVVANTRTDPRIPPTMRDSYARIAVGADLATPVVTNGRLRCTLAVNGQAPRHWTPEEVALIQGIAGRCWAEVERARAETALRESEEHLRHTVELNPQIAWTAGPDGALDHTPERWREWTGSEGAGSGWTDAVHPDDLPGMAAHWAHTVRTGTPADIEHRIRMRDGTYRWMRSRAFPRRDAAGRILRWYGTTEDIHERKVAEEKLRESEARHRADLERQVRERTAELERSRNLLQATVDSSTDMIQVFEAVRDASGEIVDFVWVLNNRTSASRYGEVREGQSLLERNPGVVPEGIFEAYRHITETGEPIIAERHYVHEQFNDWFLQSAVKLGDGVATTTKEITAWKVAQAELLHLQAEVAAAKLRESEELFRAFAENSADVIWIASADGSRLEYLSPAFERVFGEPREALLADIHRWRELIHPDDLEEATTFMPRAVAGEMAIAHYRVLRPADGRTVHLRDTGFPIRSETGAVVRVAGIVQDVSDMVAAREALEAEKERFQTLAEGIPQLVWRSCGEGLWTWASPQWQVYTGQSQEGSRGWGWLEAVCADDRERTMAAWRAARPNGRLDMEYRVRRAADGAWRWHQTRSVPIRAAPGAGEAEGRILEWLGTTTDIDDLKRLQAEQAVLVAELQHRTRNLLAVVRNVARRSIPPQAGRDEYDARLAALGRVQGFLARSGRYTVALRDLVEAELQAAGDGVSDRVTVEGPPVDLPGEGAQPVALALHELATNAVKYGAIAQPTGRLAVVWGVEGTGDERRLVIGWRESGVIMPEGLPARRGYGSELITRALPYQMRAETALEFTPDGVRCSIALPAGAFRMVGREGA